MIQGLCKGAKRLQFNTDFMNKIEAKDLLLETAVLASSFQATSNSL